METTTQATTYQIEVEHSSVAGTIPLEAAGSEDSQLAELDSMELDIRELDMDELDINGAGGRQARSYFDRHRSQTKATSFAGPNGAGSTFSHQEESISSGNEDISWD